MSRATFPTETIRIQIKPVWQAAVENYEGESNISVRVIRFRKSAVFDGLPH